MAAPTKASIFSFFSGLGFLDLGFENAGFQIKFVNEVDTRFLSAYQFARNRQDDRYYFNDGIENLLSGNRLKSIASFIKKESEKEHVGFIGGPPCPDFSVAGKNRGHQGKNGRLTKTYIDLLLTIKPDFFLLENVRGLYSTNAHRAFYETQKQRLTQAGYTLFDSIENALEYGVPQFRERLFLVGFSREKYSSQIHFSFDEGKRYRLERIRHKNWPEKNTFLVDSKLKCPNNIYKRLTVEYWFNKNDVTNHLNASDHFAPQSMNRFETIMEGDTSRKSFKRLHRWRYAPTAAYGNNEVHLHPYKKRRISVAEALAIQSLPSSFCVLPSLSLSTKFKMVGNGVPYLLSLGVAENVMKSLCMWEQNSGET